MDEQLYRAFASIEDRHWWFMARRKIVGDLITKWIPRGSTVIDVGCGTGGFLSDLQAEYRVRGIDPSPLALDACQARGLTALHEGNANDASTWGPRPVDAVTLGQLGPSILILAHRLLLARRACVLCSRTFT